MNNKLREAAKLLLNWVPIYSERRPGLYVAAAAMDVATAYLAEHPDDDNEPVTREWLSQMGIPHAEDIPCTHSGYAGCAAFFLNACLFEQASEEDSDNEDWSCVSIEYRTRGDVRRLLAVLKIPTKETR